MFHLFLTMGGSILLLWYSIELAAGPTICDSVAAAVSLESSAERFSVVVFSLTIAVEIVIVCGVFSERHTVRGKFRMEEKRT